MQEETEKWEIPTLQIMPIFTTADELHGILERSGFTVRGKRKQGRNHAPTAHSIRRGRKGSRESLPFDDDSK